MKGLEALERLRNTLLAEGYWQDVLQDVAIIEKELKALEIIKDKIMRFVSVEENLEDNKFYITDLDYYRRLELTKEEYDLLKEILL